MLPGLQQSPFFPPAPLSAPLALPLGAGSPSEGGCSPSYLCPRCSASLLVPRPQSPFDPQLGSEPCDPVGGPHSQAAGAARLCCWGESSAPFVPSSLAPVAGEPSGVMAVEQPRMAGWQAQEQRGPRVPQPGPLLASRTAPVPWRGTAGARSPRGAQIFGLRVEEKGCVQPQLSLCKYLASGAEWCSPPPAGVSWKSQFLLARGFPDFQEGCRNPGLATSAASDRQGQAASRTSCRSVSTDAGRAGIRCRWPAGRHYDGTVLPRLVWGPGRLGCAVLLGVGRWAGRGLQCMHVAREPGGRGSHSVKEWRRGEGSSGRHTFKGTRQPS